MPAKGNLCDIRAAERSFPYSVRIVYRIVVRQGWTSYPSRR